MRAQVTTDGMDVPADMRATVLPFDAHRPLGCSRSCVNEAVARQYHAPWNDPKIA